MPRVNVSAMRRAVLVVASLAAGLVPSFVSDASATDASPQPDGPAADLSEEITGGNGLFMGTAVPTDFEGTRYVEHEYVAQHPRGPTGNHVVIDLAITGTLDSLSDGGGASREGENVAPTVNIWRPTPRCTSSPRDGQGLRR
jgi:hypothetical protein